jgi:exopolysaccharide biosynthesis polyprenyl glycosylphosphotransferase
MQQSMPAALLKAHVAPFIRYPERLAKRLVLGDVAMFTTAAILSAFVLVRFFHRDLQPLEILISTLASGAIWLAIFAYAGLYRRSFALSWHDELYWVAAVSAIGILPQMLLYTLLPQISTSRLLLLVALPIDIVLISTLRTMLRRSWEKRGELRSRIAFVGEPRDVRTAESRFHFAEKTETLAIATPVWPDATPPVEGAWSRENERWFLLAKSWGADRLVFTRFPARGLLMGLISAAARYRLPIAFATRKTPVDAGEFEFDHVGSEPVLVPVLPPGCGANALVWKRLIDLVFATAGLLVFGPVMLAAAIAVYLESGGPVIYRQERIGRNGTAFEIMKFRSMRKDAESATGAVWAKAGDPRVTRVGKFLRRTSLDELPQIFNVLRGEMSIVGPRPERTPFVERFRQEMERYDERHLVRPGITGWSHVYMERDVDDSAIAERLNYDLFYIEHWSPSMDLSIIFKTGCEFLLHRIAA